MKYISLFLIALLCSCTSSQDESHTIDVAVLRGPSALAFAEWIENPPIVGEDTCRLQWVDSPEQMQALLVRNEADLAVLPMISAANLYNKGMEYPLLGCPLWGTLYLVGRENSVRPIYLFGRGTTPDILARKALGDLEKEAFNYTFGTAGELLQALLMQKAGTAVLSEPFLSVALRRDSTLQILKDLNRPEGQAVGGFPQTAIICHPSLEPYRETLDSLLQQSCRYANLFSQETIDCLERAGVFAPGMLTAESIRRCGVNYRPAAAIQEETISFLELIQKEEPSALGGKLPEASFFNAGKP